MAEENSDQQPPAPVTLASNQNLILGIIMGAVVLLLLLLLITQSFNKDGKFGGNKELEAIRQQVEERKARKEALRYAGVTSVTQNPEALVSQIKSDTEALGRLINASASDAARLRTAQDDADSMRRRINDLETQLRQYQAAASRVSGLESDLESTRQALSGSIDKGTADSLREQLSLARLERDRIKAELDQLRANQGGMIDRNTYALTQAELDELRTSNSSLRAENQRLLAEQGGAKLFVTQDDLSPRAEGLYLELKRLENESHLARKATYNRIGTQLNASVGGTVTFASGSADIARKHEASLKNMSLTAGENSFFLVVGYASPSGDSKSNQELSSQRATRVASMVNYLKKQGQTVQAVYLGEGKRFGPKDGPNQVCEVWEIRR